MTTLFTGGSVVTMDSQLGDLARGDVLVSGTTITAVGPDLREHPEAAGATVVDTTGRIVAPGFVDTHRHAWQAQMRRTIPDVGDLGAYVIPVRPRIPTPRSTASPKPGSAVCTPRWARISENGTGSGRLT